MLFRSTGQGKLARHAFGLFAIPVAAGGYNAIRYSMVIILIEETRESRTLRQILHVRFHVVPRRACLVAIILSLNPLRSLLGQ